MVAGAQAAPQEESKGVKKQGFSRSDRISSLVVRTVGDWITCFLSMVTAL